MNEVGRTDKPSTDSNRPGVPAAVNLGLNFTAGIVLFTYLGHRLDLHQGNGMRGWTLAGMLLGLVYGAYETWKLVRQPGGSDRKKRP